MLHGQRVLRFLPRTHILQVSQTQHHNIDTLLRWTHRSRTAYPLTPIREYYGNLNVTLIQY